MQNIFIILAIGNSVITAAPRRQVPQLFGKKDFRISAAPMQTASIFNSEPNGGMRIRMNVSAIFCSAIRKSPASAPFTIPMRCSSDVWPKELGRRIPEDLAISGFGNLDCLSFQEPFLTTFDQKPQELGRAAVESLLRHMNDKTLVPEKIRIKPELVIRQSTEKKQAKHSANIKHSTRQTGRKE